MAVPYFFVACFVHLATAAGNNGFISPKFQPTSNPGRFGGDSTWDLGSTQLIAFQSTWTEYKIELWQQSVNTNAAILSSTLVYNQNAGQNLAQSFYWTVQTYDLQLSDSPIFFLWLRDKTSDNQQSSAYFNITIPDAPSTSSSTSSISDTSSSTLSETLAATATQPPQPTQATQTIILTQTPSSSTTESPTITTPATSFTSDIATSVVFTSGSITPSSSTPRSSTFLSSTSGSNTIPQVSDSAQTAVNYTSGGLSRGGTVGVAVGVSVVGLIGLVGIGLFCRGRRKRRREETSRPELWGSVAPNYEYYNKPQFPPSYQQANTRYNSEPVEMG